MYRLCSKNASIHQILNSLGICSFTDFGTWFSTHSVCPLCANARSVSASRAQSMMVRSRTVVTRVPTYFCSASLRQKKNYNFCSADLSLKTVTIEALIAIRHNGQYCDIHLAWLCWYLLHYFYHILSATCSSFPHWICFHPLVSLFNIIIPSLCYKIAIPWRLEQHHAVLSCNDVPCNYNLPVWMCFKLLLKPNRFNDQLDDASFPASPVVCLVMTGLGLYDDYCKGEG